jgi:hypothetical protein
MCMSGPENVQQVFASRSKVGGFHSSTVKCRMTLKFKVVTQEGDANVLSPVLNVNGVASRTSDTGSTVSASCRRPPWITVS